MYDKVCKSCGARLSDYLETGYLGCPECYRAFENEIAYSLKQIQGSIENNGKRPSASSVDKELLFEYKRLLSERESAGLKGDFDEMARLSSEIADLSRELKNRGLL